MSESTPARTAREVPSGMTLTKVLLACGVLSSLLYVFADLLASSRYEGYVYVNQAVSELAAVGAPTRPLILALFSAYNLLVIVFAAGVWRSAGTKRSIRVAAVMLWIYAVVGQLTQMFSPMNQRGSATGANDIGHMILTAVEVLSLVLFMAFGSRASGRGFRVYSIATIVMVMAAGITTGALSTNMTELASSTPWAGAIERVNIYGTMLWIAVFSITLMRANEAAVPLAGAETAGSRTPKRVAVLMGSPHKGGATLTAARKFLANLESFGDVQGEIVTLSDYDIGVCRGCKTCFEHGEDRCPLKDDRDAVIRKMTGADAVVFASPNYSWQVPGVMKVFLDRIGFMFHRPRFHGKVATTIVVQGIYRGRQIRKYLDFAAGGLGFSVVRGSVIRTLEPMTEKATRQMDEALAKQSLRFHDRLLRQVPPSPSLFGLMMFRMGRTGIRLGVPEGNADNRYYREQGWFESDYFYPTHLGPFKRAAGAFFDWLGAHSSVFRVAEQPVQSGGPSSSSPIPH